MCQDCVESHLHRLQNSSQDLQDVTPLLQIDDSIDPLRLHRRVYEELRLHDLLQDQVDRDVVVETNGPIHGCETMLNRVGDHVQENEVILQDPQDLRQDLHRIVEVEVGVQNVKDVVDVLRLAVQSLQDLVIDHGQDPQHLKVFLGAIIIGKMIVRLSIAIRHRSKRG